MTDLMRALTAEVRVEAVGWKYQRTIPPLVNIVNRSNISRQTNLPFLSVPFVSVVYISTYG